MTKIINFYGGPSAGKSTMAAQLFGYMKAGRMNVEYVPEFAKTLTWRKAACLDDQLYVLGNQHHELYTLLGQVDYVITDSPLLMQLHYISIGFSKFKPTASVPDVFEELVLSLYQKYDNHNFYVERGDRKFIQAGRNQNEEESKEIDDSIHEILVYNAIPFKRVSNMLEIVVDLFGEVK